jgi:hypothetical protein
VLKIWGTLMRLATLIQWTEHLVSAFEATSKSQQVLVCGSSVLEGVWYLNSKGDNGGADRASNAFQERRRRSKVRAVANLELAQIFLAVHRLDFSVYFRRIEPEEFALLSALRNGKSIERAIELAFRKSSIPAANRGASVQHSFQTWAALGWFCQPEENARGEKSREKGCRSKS